MLYCAWWGNRTLAWQFPSFRLNSAVRPRNSCFCGLRTIVQCSFPSLGGALWTPRVLTRKSSLSCPISQLYLWWQASPGLSWGHFGASTTNSQNRVSLPAWPASLGGLATTSTRCRKRHASFYSCTRPAPCGTQVSTVGMMSGPSWTWLLPRSSRCCGANGGIRSATSPTSSTKKSGSRSSLSRPQRGTHWRACARSGTPRRSPLDPDLPHCGWDRTNAPSALRGP